MKKKTNRIETIEQIDYDLKANNKLPPDKLYPETEQNKQNKEPIFKRNKTSNAHEKHNMNNEDKNAKIGKENASEFDGDEVSKKINLEKTEKIKSAIKKFLSLRSL